MKTVFIFKEKIAHLLARQKDLIFLGTKNDFLLAEKMKQFLLMLVSLSYLEN